jgi:hypothetical protein
VDHTIESQHGYENNATNAVLMRGHCAGTPPRGGCASLPDSRIIASPQVFTEPEENSTKFPVAGIIAMGLQQLQHRGQESCGIVTSDDEGEFHSLKGACAPRPTLWHLD